MRTQRWSVGAAVGGFARDGRGRDDSARRRDANPTKMKTPASSRLKRRRWSVDRPELGVGSGSGGGVTHVLLVLGVERGDDRSRGGGVVAVRLDVEIVGGLGADLAPGGGRGLLLEQAHHGARGWGTRREVVTFGAVASHAETFARGKLRDEDGVRWGASAARWEGEAPRARETPRVREANPTSCDVGCQSAGWRDKKNVLEASGDDGVRARGTAGRGFAPRGRRAGCPLARSARFPRVAPLATTGTRVPPESPSRAISRLRSPRFLRVRNPAPLSRASNAVSWRPRPAFRT